MLQEDAPEFLWWLHVYSGPSSLFEIAELGLGDVVSGVRNYEIIMS